ncbi:hypothetical protein ACMXYQ_12755 [Neptuniibacter sp. PT34_22]|uniref:hypothetical protein n=1 Tax=Neptuniibacter sp. PT34_22 TaxID=3398205 RepID=UPI0039F4C542
MIKKDFEFVTKLAEDFFAQKHIQKRLRLIEKNNITGWEIWLQIEFSVFIDGHIDIGEWYREYPYSIDRRSARNRSHMAIDFIFRKKRTSLDRFIALEFKQHINVKACIRGMMEDTCKVSLVKISEDDLRSMWSLGIHSNVESQTLSTVIENYAEQYNVGLEPDCIFSKPIRKTNLAYTVF